MQAFNSAKSFYFTFLVIVMNSLVSRGINAETIALNTDNIAGVLSTTELVFVNFYADWCRFSQMLGPIFDDTANKIRERYPDGKQVVLAKVDCDNQNSIAQKYHVSKYPTLKLIRNGEVIKREYRGQRSVDALVKYIDDQLKNPINKVQKIDDLEVLDRKKRNVIGYFDSDNSMDYDSFKKAAKALREECSFHVAVGEMSQAERISGNRIAFRQTHEEGSDIPYTGSLVDFNNLFLWIQDKCVPLVREITFENAEELTEEGLPFLILFHNPEDTETPQKFKNIVARELMGEKSAMNFLTADGLKFSHPLYHLGKSSTDLPVLAIDSFRHMYVFSQDVKSEIETPGRVKQFIADLHSGKLHREFHHGPDKTEAPKEGGSSESAIVSKQHTDSNGAHVDVQQQMIIGNGGVQIRIVRVVGVGQPLQLNIRDQINAIEKALIEGKNINDALHHRAPNEITGNDKQDTTTEVEAESAQYEHDINPRGHVLQKESTDNVKEDKLPLKQAGGTDHLPTEDLTDRNKRYDLLPEEEIVKRSFDNDEDYDVIHSKTKRIKIQGIPNQATQNTPPRSIFRNLGPSKHRYTFEKEEL